jgi:hypothetical protein
MGCNTLASAGNQAIFTFESVTLGWQVPIVKIKNNILYFPGLNNLNYGRRDPSRWPRDTIRKSLH